jgi:transposase
LVPEIWLPTPEVRQERERARFRLHLVQHRSALKNRIHAILIAFGHPRPMADLFGVAGRELLDSLALPEPWKTNLVESLALVDDLSTRIDALESELRSLGADHPSMRLLMTVPGVGWVLAYTIASEIGDISRFASPKKLAGYNRAVPARSSVRGQGPARATGQERPDVPSLGPDRGRHPRRPGSSLSRSIRAHQGAARSPAWRQGRPGRSRPPAGRGDLVCPH